jgi:hypothetical protein
MVRFIHLSAWDIIWVRVGNTPPARRFFCYVNFKKGRL